MKNLKPLVFLAVAIFVITIIKSPLYPDSSEINTYIRMFPNISFSLAFLKTAKIILYMFSVLVFQKWTKNWLSALLFSIIPWNLYLFSFNPISSLVLLLFLLYLNTSKKYFIIIIILLLFWQIKNVPKEVPIISELDPEKIALEIKEDIDVQFFSVNRAFLIHKIPRKVLYNYPLVSSIKIANKAVSYFDLEQWATPLDSYAITRRSGLLPKNNWQLIYLWQIPFLLMGIYLFFKKRIKPLHFKKVFTISFLIFLLFSKRDILTSQILLLPYIALLTTYGLTYFLKLIKNKKLLLAALLTFASFQTLYSFRYFSNRQQDFRYTNGYIFYLNHEIYEKYRSDYKKIMISDRYGDSETAFYFYNQKKENISFGTFELEDENISNDTLFIGLSGEFPENYAVIEKHQLWNPPVSDFGEELWAGYKE